MTENDQLMVLANREHARGVYKHQLKTVTHKVTRIQIFLILRELEGEKKKDKEFKQL
jgi:hypothetical protein